MLNIINQKEITEDKMLEEQMKNSIKNHIANYYI